MSKAAGRATVFVLSLLVFGAVAGLGGYYAGGRSDAIDDSRPLARLADRLLAHGKGGPGLGVGREAVLLTVLDPAFADDPQRTDAGVGVLARDLAWRMAREQSVSRLGQIRRAGYASGLEAELSRSSLVALWLETVEMGRGPHGWLRGLYDASRALYGRKPEQLTDDQFVRLLAIATTPAKGQDGHNSALDTRVRSIQRLIAAACKAAPASDDLPDRCGST